MVVYLEPPLCNRTAGAFIVYRNKLSRSLVATTYDASLRGIIVTGKRRLDTFRSLVICTVWSRPGKAVDVLIGYKVAMFPKRSSRIRTRDQHCPFVVDHAGKSTTAESQDGSIPSLWNPAWYRLLKRRRYASRACTRGSVTCIRKLCFSFMKMQSELRTFFQCFRVVRVGMIEMIRVYHIPLFVFLFYVVSLLRR